MTRPLRDIPAGAAVLVDANVYLATNDADFARIAGITVCRPD